MSSQEEKIIELSKGKIFLLIFVAIAFVVIGIWMLTLDSETIEGFRRFNSPTLVFGIGIASIILFGLMGAIGFRKLFDNSPGLILNQDGFTDNSSGVSAGQVPWSEVVEIGQYEIQRQKFVSIYRFRRVRRRRHRLPLWLRR